MITPGSRYVQLFTSSPSLWGTTPCVLQARSDWMQHRLGAQTCTSSFWRRWSLCCNPYPKGRKLYLQQLFLLPWGQLPQVSKAHQPLPAAVAALYLYLPAVNHHKCLWEAKRKRAPSSDESLLVLVAGGHLGTYWAASGTWIPMFNSSWWTNSLTLHLYSSTTSCGIWTFSGVQKLFLFLACLAN